MVTVGTSFNIDSSSLLEQIKEHFMPILQQMEEDYNEEFNIDTRVKIRDLGPIESPRPVSTPQTPKASSSRSQTNAIIQAMQAQTQAILQSQQTQTKALLEAVKTPSINWEPLITVGTTLVDRVIDRLLPPAPQTTAAPASSQTPQTPQTPKTPFFGDLGQIEAKMIARIEQMETQTNAQLAQQNKTLEVLAQSQAQQGKALENLIQTVTQLSQGFNTLTKIVATTTGTPSNGSSTPPAAPSSTPSPASTPSTEPAPQPITGNSNQMVDDIQTAKKVGVRKLHTSALIKAGRPYNKELELGKVVTADLESLITKEGYNQVYMAAWYNGSNFKEFNISNYENNSHLMLQAFWQSLLTEAQGCTVYFHNWAGYDAILSMASLVSLHKSGYLFEPILQKGRVICLTVKLDKHIVLTIKDSILLIPGSLGKLAKDFKVETQKDHFPHYFNPLELEGDLDWTGPLPAYEYFEPKRTSPDEYKELESLYPDNWNFIEVSRKYIHGDVVSLHQILVNFFTELNLKFRVNPLNNLSAPGIAYTTWKTEQLPLLHQDNLEVYDLSRTSDDLFREVYLEGIVDVYRPHLIGQGFYYDETWSEEYKATFSTVLRSTKFWFLFLNRKIRSNL
jgi:hypothetical protein